LEGDTTSKQRRIEAVGLMSALRDALFEAKRQRAMEIREAVGALRIFRVTAPAVSE
jgi:hypothetical protein